MIKKKKGFTLIEIIIVMALTVVILGMVFRMFNTNNRIISDIDIKSTLQTEGQAIQEKLSNIGMQAIGIESVTEKNGSEKIKNIVINSYDKNGEECKFEIQNNERKFYINGKEISNNVESMEVSPDLIDDKESLDTIKTIQFNILLTKKKGYSNIKYPVSVKITFRNNGKE